VAQNKSASALQVHSGHSELRLLHTTRLIKEHGGAWLSPESF